MTTDTQRLRSLAEAAAYEDEMASQTSPQVFSSVSAHMTYLDAVDDPQTVLGLMDECDKLREAVVELTNRPLDTLAARDREVAALREALTIIEDYQVVNPDNEWAFGYAKAASSIKFRLERLLALTRATPPASAIRCWHGGQEHAWEPGEGCPCPATPPASAEPVCGCGPWQIGQPQGHLPGCPRATPPEGASDSPFVLDAMPDQE
jgi:hypothetical protein